MKLVIEKSNHLNGRIRISGSKNAVLPIMAASILTDKICYLEDVPNLIDVLNMTQILKQVGSDITFDAITNQIKVQTINVTNSQMTNEYISKMRASILMLGPMIARTGYAKIFHPGGCNIGTRPIDLHLKGLQLMGVEIKREYGYIEAHASNLKGAKIYLDYPSVGATENILMAATLADGETIIENAAVEPEIVDLANFLIKMGANITDAGTDTIKICGVSSLSGTSHRIIPDRIETGTYMLAAAITQGNITLDNVNPTHMKPLIAKLEENDVKIEINENSICTSSSYPIKPTNIKTLPYPGFPTDLQAPYMVLLTKAKGTSVVTETIFENRFMHVGELLKMGANINVEGSSSIITGVDKLSGTNVNASDLRAGMALLLAGLIADGETVVDKMHHIERGYENVVEKFLQLGAKIKKT